MGNILMTMAEDVNGTSAHTFGLRYPVDEHDCLHFAESLKELGHKVYFVNWIDFHGDEFVRMFSYNNSEYVTPIKMSDIDLTFVYKMEGFYDDLPRFIKMIERFDECTVVINDVATIKHNLNKNYLLELKEQGIATIPQYTIAEVKEKLGRGEKFVIKPLNGERGKGIFLAENIDDLKSVAGMENRYFAQQFMSSIRCGERSLVFLGHEYQHAVIKHPSAKDPNEFRCNESLGGTVDVYEPTNAEKTFCLDVLEKYAQLGYPAHFSRIDVLSTNDGPVLLEAELLNPSIYANYSRKGKEFGNKIANYFDLYIKTKQKAPSV